MDPKGTRGVVLHANCFHPPLPDVDTLLTDETLVAGAAAPHLTVISPERRVDDEVAHLTSIAMSRAASDWFHVGAEDPSIVAGISAGDLAVAEAACTVLLPAARGVLAMAAALDGGLEPSTLISVVPAGDERYARLETLAADAAVAAIRARLGTSVAIRRIASHDARNSLLLDKYAGVRDPDLLIQTGTRRRLSRAIVLGLVNAHAHLRRRNRPALMVVEYNPSRHFARAYGARRSRRWRLLRWPAQPRDLVAIARAGDRALLPRAPDLSARAQGRPSLREHADAMNGSALCVAGVDLWPVVREPLLALAERYGRYVNAFAVALERELRQNAVRAVLVPFDTPAQARLVVRVAQKMGIPTFVLNDGYKADDIQQEGMTADVAFAWSEAIRDCYFSRRANSAVVTGNPHSAYLPRIASRRHRRRRVLVGAHSFSPIDLNCGRSDAERFLEEVLEGIAAAHGHLDPCVVAKLHPSDAPSYYRTILQRYSQLAVELRSDGDVIDLFDDCDVYVATYSTSLLEAIGAGLPVIYYRVNAQRLGPPFSHDAFLATRSASTPAQLAALLADREALATRPPDDWIEHYLGPSTGAVDRVLSAIATHTEQ
jgi:glycosyltransferase involved in cell wall biosynthesis